MPGSVATTRSPAVRKAVRALQEIAAQPEPVSMSALSRALNTPKSSLADICGVLIAERVLARDLDGGLQLGPRLVTAARAFVGGTRLLEVFPSVVADADALHGQTVVLATLLGPDAVYLAVRAGRRPLALTLKPGMRLPAWSTGTGQALLSLRDDDEIRAMHQDRPPSSPSGQQFDIEALLTAVHQARRRGYASNLDLGGMTLSGTAAIVQGPLGPVAAVGTVADYDDGDPDREAPATQALALALTAALD